MARFLLRTKAAASDCDTHLRASGAFGGPIEDFLTQYLLVLLCADVQTDVYSLVAERGGRSSDPGLEAYTLATVKRVFRSVSKDEVATLAGMFGAHVRDRLNVALDDKVVTLYGNAVTNRHRVAHSSGVTMSFADVQAAIGAAESILQALESALQ